MKTILLESVEKLLEGDIITAQEYTRLVQKIQLSNNIEAPSESETISDNEESQELNLCFRCNIPVDSEYTYCLKCSDDLGLKI